MFGDSSLCPIGIDIGADVIRVLQLRHRTGQLALVAAAAAEIPGPRDAAAEPRAAAVTATLRRLLATGAFVGKACVTALAPTAVHAKSVRLPQMPPEDLAQAVRWEAKDRFGFDLTDGHIAHFPAGEIRRGSETKDELLLFAATAETLRSHLDQILPAGLQPHAVDLAPCALYRAVQRTTALRAGVPLALVDIALTGTQLLIVHDDRLAFYKHIEIGAASFDAAIAQKLGVPPEEAAQIRQRLMGAPADEPDAASSHIEQAVFDALRPTLEELARELDMCMRYYVVTFRGARPETMAVTGPHAYSARIIEAIASILALRLEAAAPLRGVANLTADTRADRSSPWTLAAGLSLYTLAEARASDAPSAGVAA